MDNLSPSNCYSQVDLLAKIYSLILSWPDPGEGQTTGSDKICTVTKQGNSQELPLKTIPADVQIGGAHEKGG